MMVRASSPARTPSLLLLCALLPGGGCGSPDICVGDCTDTTEQGSDDQLASLRSCTVVSTANNASCGDGLAQPDEICLAAPVLQVLDASPETAVAGDFNGDGFTDVLWSTSTTARLRLGAAVAPLTTDVVWTTLSSEEPLLFITGVGDLDGDGALDAVGNDNSDRVLLFRGDGAGGLAQVVVPYEGLSAWGPTVLDYEGDGDLDLVVLAPDLDPTSLVLLNDGAGQFSIASLPADGDPRTERRIAFGDLDGVMPVDHVAGGLGEFSIRARGGAAPAVASVALDADYLHVVDVELADLDTDGRTDLVLSLLDHELVAPPDWPAAEIYGGIAVLLAGEPLPDGTLTFDDRSYLPMDCGSSQLRLSDLDGDSSLDVVSSHSVAPGQSASLVVRRGDGSGGFESVHRIPAPAGVEDSGDVLLGDFDGDGQRDVAVLHRGEPALAVYRGNP